MRLVILKLRSLSERLQIVILFHCVTQKMFLKLNGRVSVTEINVIGDILGAEAAAGGVL